MQAIPTTTVSILRGTTTTAANDVVDSNTPVYTGVPASIMERTRTGIDVSTQSPQVYHHTVGRLPAGTDVTETDKILDETTGKMYAIAAVSTLSSFVHVPDLRLDLRHVN